MRHRMAIRASKKSDKQFVMSLVDIMKVMPLADVIASQPELAELFEQGKE